MVTMEALRRIIEGMLNIKENAKHTQGATKSAKATIELKSTK